MVAQSGHAVADELASDPIVRREPLMQQDPYMGSGPPARRDSQIRRAPNSSGLYDVVDLILDKGIVIDAFVRVSLVGIELLTVDLRVVIASVDTYLRYAEGVERLQVYDRSRSMKLPDIVGGGMKKGAIKEGAKKVGKAITGGDDDEDENKGEGITGTLSRGVRKLVGTFTGGKGEDEDEEKEEQRHNGRGEDGGKSKHSGRDRGSKR